MIDLSIQTREQIDSSKLRPIERLRLLLRLQRLALPLWDKMLLRMMCT